MSDEPEAHADADATLDHALSALPSADVDPLWARSTRIAAERRLLTGRRPLSRSARFEPFLLIALSALQLLWAAIRVFALAR